MLKQQWPEIKLIKQYSGGKLIIGVEGDKKKITEFYTQIFNYEGTDSELNYMSDRFLYFFTNEKRFEKALKIILQDKMDKIAAKSCAKKFVEEILPEGFIDSELKSVKTYEDLTKYNLE